MAVADTVFLDEFIVKVKCTGRALSFALEMVCKNLGPLTSSSDVSTLGEFVFSGQV